MRTERPFLGLHGSVGRGSWVEPVGNDCLLEGVDIEPHWGNLVLGRYPPDLLGLFLHEATHHWCFNSILGTALSLIWLKARRAAFKIEEASSDNQRYDLLDDYLRYHLTLRIMHPLAEGLALFSEHDLTPQGCEVSPPPLLWALLSFTGALSNEDLKKSIPDCERVLREMLWALRFEEGIDQKADLLCRTILSSTNAGRDAGYLAGYLTTKRLWRILCQRDDRFFRGEFFVSFVKAYFYEDLGFVGAIFDPTRNDAQIADSIQNYYQRRFANIINITREDVDNFERDSLRESTSEEVSILEQTHAMNGAREDIELGRRCFTNLLDSFKREVSQDEKAAFLSGLDIATINRRHLMRVATGTVRLEIRNGRANLYSKTRKMGSDLPQLLMSIPALDDVGEWEGDGRAEFHISMRDGFAALVVFGKQKLVAVFTPPGVTKDHIDRIKSYKFQTDPESIKKMKEVSEQMIEQSLSGPVGHVRSNIIEKMENLTNALYLVKSLPARTDVEAANLERIMKSDGFWGLLNENKTLLRALAFISLKTSNNLTVTPEILELVQVSCPKDIADLRTVLSQHSLLPLLLGDTDNPLCMEA